MTTRQEMMIQEPGTNGGWRSGRNATRINENCHAKRKKLGTPKNARVRIVRKKKKAGPGKDEENGQDEKELIIFS